MKAYIWLPFALLVGLVVGGLGPRSELARTQEELKTTKELLRKNGGAASGLGDVTRLLGIERSSGEQEHAAESAGHDEESVPDGDLIHVHDSDTSELSHDDPAVAEQEAVDEPNREFGGDIDRAVELWQARGRYCPFNVHLQCAAE